MYKPSKTYIARLNREGQLDLAEYSRIKEIYLVHIEDLAGGYLKMLKESIQLEDTRWLGTTSKPCRNTYKC